MEVSEIKINNKSELKPLNVCAYVRVSTKSEEQLHSLKAQIDYYKKKISENPCWKFSGIYVDFGISGTKNNRPQFQKMIEKCELGEIDLIIVKSVSRFARNTVTVLETVRKLRNIGVDVFFEKENIHTLNADGEFLLTVISSVAQAESESISANTRWSIQKYFATGVNRSRKLLGYDSDHGVLKINENEAKIVRVIFNLYLTGFGIMKISKILKKANYDISPSGVWYILRNESYRGDMILQKTYCDINQKRKINKGELQKYIVTESHEPIISREMFEEFQEKIKFRRKNMPNVTVIPAKIDRFSKGKIYDKSKKKRVCAYARVSTDYDEQLSSYESQVAYYTELIKGHKEWEFVNVYSDMYNQRLIQRPAYGSVGKWLK